MDYLRGVLGLATLVGLAYLLSTNRRAINWKLVGAGLAHTTYRWAAYPQGKRGQRFIRPDK